jgi:hypothetical protein
VLLQQNNNAACVQEVIRGPKTTTLRAFSRHSRCQKQRRMRSVVIGGLKINAACFQVVIRDPKYNAACVQEVIEVPKKQCVRSRKVIRDPKKQSCVPSGNNWTSQQTKMRAFRSSFEVPKNQTCMSSARHSRSQKERPSCEPTNRRLETEIPKRRARNRRPGIQISPPVPQILSPAATPAGDSWICESRSSWPIKLYDRWQSLSSQVACSVQPRGIVRKLNHDVWIAFTGSLF